MNPDELQLLISYAELAKSIAFRDFLQYQAGECERLELAALSAPSTEFEQCRSAIIAWQQRRLVVRELENTVKDAADGLRSNEQENIDVRTAAAAERASRGNW